ncbi:MAG: T9SS type A sorting domain-containing protein [Saprospiraceae bacterium]|nr:T9SS type A sorting domain-containing protein [Candidatus Vicinibacter affinis]
MDSDCDKVGDACDVCPNGDDSVDNNGDGLPDCKYPPTFANILSSWKCGTIPQRVYVASIASNGQCTRRCVLYTTYLRDKGPNLHLGPCKACGEGFTNGDSGEEVVEYIYDEQEDTQVALSKPKGEYDFILVPNPNEGEFEIQFDQPVDQGTVKVINMLGQEVWSFEIKELTHLIKVSEQAFKFHTSGMYRVMLLSNNGKKIHNLMIISK